MKKNDIQQLYYCLGFFYHYELGVQQNYMIGIEYYEIVIKYKYNYYIFCGIFFDVDSTKEVSNFLRNFRFLIANHKCIFNYNFLKYQLKQ